jgi:hypothetical protein
MTIYLKFPSQDDAVTALNEAGYEISEWKDHFDGNGWGTILPDPNTTDFLANIYDCEVCPESLLPHEIPTPKNPLNVVAL